MVDIPMSVIQLEIDSQQGKKPDGETRSMSSQPPIQAHPCQGIWRIDREVEAQTPADKHLLWHDAFVCHSDGSISVYLFGMSPEPDAPTDGIYRLESLWKGDTLFYRLPNGIEVELATFHDGRFEMEGDNRIRSYRRITPEELLPDFRPLLDTNRPIRRQPHSPSGGALP